MRYKRTNYLDGIKPREAAISSKDNSYFSRSSTMASSTLTSLPIKNIEVKKARRAKKLFGSIVSSYKLSPLFFRRVSLFAAIILLVGVPLFNFFSSSTPAQALYTATNSLYPDGDNTAGWELCTNAACSGTNHYTLVDETSANDADYVNTGLAGNTTGEIDDYTIQNPTINGTFVQTTQVVVNWRAKIDTACQGTAPNCDSVSVNIYINGALQTAQTTTLTTTITNYTTTFNTGWSAINDLRIRFTRNAVGVGAASVIDDDVRLYQANVSATYTYYKNKPQLALKGYIWEMDDASGDVAGQLAPGSTAVSARKGERLTLRTQLKNTSGPVDTENLALFYDTGDGIWRRVKGFQKPESPTGNCLDTNYQCFNVDTSSQNSQIGLAFDSSGGAWVATRNATAGNLRVDYYTKGGGTSTSGVVTTNDVGSYASIAMNSNGKPWIAYKDNTAGSLRLAYYVGSGGSCDSTDWQCVTVDSVAANTGQDTSIAISRSSSDAWVSYYDVTNTNLRVAGSNNPSGTACTLASWECTTIDSTGDVGSYSKLALDNNSNPWIAYYDNTNNDLKVAQYVGAGAGTGCASNYWTCTSVDTGGNVGGFTSIAMDPSGNPWVSYYDTTNLDLKVAQYVGSGGSGCASSAWTCTSVDTSGSVGGYTSLAFDPIGNPWVSYQDITNTALKLARFVGSGGSGCASSAWSCTTVETTNSVGYFTSLAFDQDGVPWVAHEDLTTDSVRMAYLRQSLGAITLSSSQAGVSAFAESHADMTTTSDTSNRDDADCIGGGTWNNGKSFASDEGTGVSVADGSSTAQCTEVAWTIDTSQATINSTYRFFITTDDGERVERGRWRGPIAIDAFPTLTIEDDTKYNTTQILTKGTISNMPDCADTNWGCTAIDTATNVGGAAENNSYAVDRNGVGWISYYDQGNGDLRVANYVGTGGTGCALSSWTCTSVDTTNDVGQFTSIGIDSNGNPWVSYRDITNTGLRVARYVGSGGTGCASTAWTCTAVYNTGDSGSNGTSIAFDKSGVAWVSFRDSTATDLLVAKYVGSGGTGCVDSTWNCNTIASTGNVGYNSSLVFDQDNNIVISYRDATGTDLKIARYVGNGGSCDVSPAWDCGSVDNPTNTVGHASSAAYDPTGAMWISHYDYDAAGLNLRVTKYVGTGGSCSNTAWSCTAVDTGGDVGEDTSIGFDSTGNAWVSYYDLTNGNLKVAKYVGSGGTGCASAAWNCTAVDTANNVGAGTAIAFDPNGNPSVVYGDSTNNDLRIATYKTQNVAPTFSTVNIAAPRNAIRSSGRYVLSNGQPSATPASHPCSGVLDMLGLCGALKEDGGYETMVAGVYERPMVMQKARFSNNSTAPTLAWTGLTDYPPNTAGTAGDLKLQIYRFGTTNAWEDVATDNSSSSCSSSSCKLNGMPGGTISEYFETEGSNYNVYFRVIQIENTSGSITFKTDVHKATQVVQQLRHGRTFNRSLSQPFATEQR